LLKNAIQNLKAIRRNYSRERSPERTQKVIDVLGKRQPDITVVLENVHDPHNVMAVLRTCDSVGIYEVHVIDNLPRKWDPRIGKNSSSGAKKWVPMHKYDTVDECYSVLKNEGKRILTTHMDESSKDLFELDLTEPIALVFGNEHSGVSDEAVAKGDGNFIIPQVGMIQSLNISVACAVTLYEAFRQKTEQGHYGQSRFEATKFKELKENWLKL